LTGSPLAILLVGDYPDDPRLGSSKVSHKLREEFEALGHTCDVVWTDEIGQRPRSRQIRQLVSPWMAGRAVARRMRRRRYDVVDIASAEGLWIGVRGFLSNRGRPAFVCRSHGLEHLNYARMVDDHVEGVRSKSWTRRLWYPLSRLSQVAAAARLADRLLVVNEADRAFAIERGWQPPGRVVVVSHGISERFLGDAPEADTPRGAGLLFCGTWDYVKGITYLCAAINRLHANGHKVRLTVLGPGAPAAAVLSNFDVAVRPFVTVIDRVPEDQVMAEYRRHDALLWTSSYEGFGLVLIEAMSQGLPAISTPSGCAASVIRHGENGVLVPFRSVDALVSAIADLLADDAARRRFGAAARSAVTGMTWRATAERTLAVYREAMAAGARG
jgi:glycosyltransferase involved in cell wall biosynthesis